MKDADRDNLIFELIKRRYDSEIARTNNLDGKANNLIGFTTIVVGLLLGAGSFNISTLASANNLLVFYFVGIGALLLTVGLSLTAHKVRSWIVVPNVQTLIGKYATKEYSEVLQRNAGEMAKAVVYSEINNNNKARLIGWSWYSLISGLSVMFIFMLVYTLSKLVVQ